MVKEIEYYFQLVKFTYFLLLCRHFQIPDKNKETEAYKLFSVPDFVGDACKAVASRVRGAVAGVQFDDFHKVSRSLRYLYAKFLGEIA